MIWLTEDDGFDWDGDAKADERRPLVNFCDKWNVEYDGRREPHWDLSVVHTQRRQVAVSCCVEAARGTGSIGRRKSSV